MILSACTKDDIDGDSGVPAQTGPLEPRGILLIEEVYCADLLINRPELWIL